MARRDWKREIEEKARDLEGKAEKVIESGVAYLENAKAEADGLRAAAAQVRTLLEGPDDTED